MNSNTGKSYVGFQDYPEKFLFEFVSRKDICHAKYKIFRHNGSEISFHTSGRGIPLPDNWKEVEEILKEKPYDVVMASAVIKENNDQVTLTNNQGTNMIVTSCDQTYSAAQIKQFIEEGRAFSLK